MRKLHHSVADWDFEDTRWELSNERFISPPTSLRKTTGDRCAVLCRHPETRILPQGRMSTYLWEPFRFSSIFIFRAQTLIGISNHLNNYSLRTSGVNSVALWRTIAGVEDTIGSWHYSSNPETWVRLRVTWWNGYDPHNDFALIVELDKEIDGEWATRGKCYDPDNLWKDSIMNRCGVELKQPGQFLDNSEIWIPH